MQAGAPNPPAASSRWRALDLRIADGRVRVHLLGAGRPVLFLHGLSAHGRSWRRTAERLVERRPGVECWLPDLLGRGESDADPALRYTLDDEVGRLAELLPRIAGATGGEDRLPELLAGHSHGAALALAFAVRTAGVRALVLSNPVTADIRRPAVLAALGPPAVRRVAAALFGPLRAPLARLILRRAAGPRFRPPAEMVRAYAAPYADPQRARTLMRILADWHPAELAGSLPDRGLVAHVLAGAHDPRVPAAAAERLARRLDARYTRVADGGHVLPEQHPELLAEALSDALDALERPAAGGPPAGAPGPYREASGGKGTTVEAC